MRAKKFRERKTKKWKTKEYNNILKWGRRSTIESVYLSSFSNQSFLFRFFWCDVMAFVAISANTWIAKMNTILHRQRWFDVRNYPCRVFDAMFQIDHWLRALCAGRGEYVTIGENRFSESILISVWGRIAVEYEMSATKMPQNKSIDRFDCGRNINLNWSQ